MTGLKMKSLDGGLIYYYRGSAALDLYTQVGIKLGALVPWATFSAQLLRLRFIRDKYFQEIRSLINSEKPRHKRCTDAERIRQDGERGCWHPSQDTICNASGFLEPRGWPPAPRVWVAEACTPPRYCLIRRY
jgi:hypothetical protein